MSKSELSSASPLGAKNYIKFVARFHANLMVSLDTGWKEKAERGGYKRGTGPMRKKKFIARWQMEASVQER